jgi:hypothetical protein
MYKAQAKNRLIVIYRHKRRDISLEDIMHNPHPRESKAAYVSCCNVRIRYCDYKEQVC